MIQMRVCATNEVFLPRIEQMRESWSCAKIVDRYCIEMMLCGSTTQTVDKMKLSELHVRGMYECVQANSPGYPGTLQVFHQISRSPG